MQRVYVVAAWRLIWAILKKSAPEHALDYDVMVLDAPNHMGKPSQAMKNFINHLAPLGLTNKKVAVFGTYAGKER